MTFYPSVRSPGDPERAVVRSPPATPAA